MIKIIEKLIPIEHQETLKNNTILENVWHLKDDSDFEKKVKEFYEPNIWFTGKKRVFETHIAKNIKKTKDSIVLCSFLLEKTAITDAILEVVENSVRVYIITASENQLDKIYELESELEDDRIVEHKNLLKILRKKCLIRSAPHFHAKYILIDSKNDSRLGFLSSANFTQHAFTNNVEIGIQLNPDQIIDLFNLFCYIFWNESKHEYLTEKTLRSVKKPPKNFLNAPQLNHIISPGMSIDFEDILKEVIESSTGDIYISTYSIDSKNSIFKLLLNELKKKRGVTINIRPRKNDLEALNKLQQAGTKIKGHPLLHFKCLLVDNAKNNKGIIFTGNITEESFGKSHDVGIFLNPQQYRIILDILKNWENILPGVFIGKDSISKLPIGKYWKWNPYKYEFQIQTSEIYDMGTFEGDYIDTYNDFKPKLEIPNELKEITKEIIFRWRNTPPKLPTKSKKVENLPESIPKKYSNLIQNAKLYQKGKEYYLLYQKGDNLKELKRISNLTKFKIVI